MTTTPINGTPDTGAEGTRQAKARSRRPSRFFIGVLQAIVLVVLIAGLVSLMR